MDKNKIYDKNFYEGQRDKSKLSASKIVPYIIEILKPIAKIESVVDFGCGVGGWLAEFKKNGVTNILGIDFGNANKDQYYIDIETEFSRKDLTRVIDLEKKYDLAISLECAEHISEVYANIFVENLCKASDIVMFGAAIPGQGGVEHVNEQPQSYWIQKFSEHGYNCYDIIRPRFWSDNDVESWYRQDTFVFINKKIDVSACEFEKVMNNMPYNVASLELVRLLRAEIESNEKHLLNRKLVKKILHIQ